MSNDQLIGRQLASYRLERFIGQGGMARVYYAWDESLERGAALKVIRANQRGDTTYAERFVQEARAISQWRHENVLQVYYAGQEDDLYFFAMEYVDGLNLEQVLSNYVAQGELIPHDDVIRIGQAVANALDYAHSKHVIHRDVKPSNIMIDRENRVVLADFGLALDTQRGSMGQTFGTPHYIAPEQARNSADAVPQSDLYSLGIILYEMLTGVVPFDDPSSMSLALKHLTEAPPPLRELNPALSEEVEAIILKALAKEPQERYATGTVLMEDLTDALRAQTVAGESVLTLPPLPGGVKRPSATPAISRYSVSEQVRLSAPMPPPPPPTGWTPLPTSPPPPSATAPTRSRQIKPLRWLGLGMVGLLVFLILALGLFVVLGGGDGGGRELETAVISSPNDDGVAAAVDSTATATPGSDEEIPLAEPTLLTAATEEVAIPRTTATPGEEIVPTPTEEPAATSTAEPQPTSAPAEATPVFPDGTPIDLVYNFDSFYLYNTSGERVRVSTISFQAIDEAGRPLRYGMEGNRWTQFYAFVDGYACNRIEPFGAEGPYLRPGYCRSYSATVTPARDGAEIFWRERDGAVAFRVLWEGQEIGRCDLAPGSCTVYIP
jgi:serine/threonine protein kinase